MVSVKPPFPRDCAVAARKQGTAAWGARRLPGARVGTSIYATSRTGGLRIHAYMRRSELLRSCAGHLLGENLACISGVIVSVAHVNDL